MVRVPFPVCREVESVAERLVGLRIERGVMSEIGRRVGLFFFALGTLGIGVPLLPTVPFWILAAICFARSDPALQRKIYDHPRFGTTVRQFVENRVLSRRAKLSRRPPPRARSPRASRRGLTTSSTTRQSSDTSFSLPPN